MKYLGFDGCGGKRNGNSMQSVGEPYGLTREMVRQIVAAFQDLAHLVNPRKDLPSLIASIKHLHTIAPCDATFAEQSLVDQGLAQRPFRIEGILAAAEIFNVALKDLALSHYRQGRFLVNRSVHDEIPSALLSKAGSLVSHNGAAHIQDLIRTLSRDHGIRLPKSKSYGFVLAALQARDEEDFVWVDEAAGWFTYSKLGRNRVLNRVEKMFTVCKSVNLIDVRAGIARSFAKDKQEKYVLLSAPILAKLLELTGDYIVTDEVVTAKSPGDIEILHENEALLAKYIVDSGEPVVREGEMERAVIFRNKASDDQSKTYKFGFSIALNFSPIVVKDNQRRGHYRLVGEPRPNLKSKLSHLQLDY